MGSPAGRPRGPGRREARATASGSPGLLPGRDGGHGRPVPRSSSRRPGTGPTPRRDGRGRVHLQIRRPGQVEKGPSSTGGRPAATGPRPTTSPSSRSAGTTPSPSATGSPARGPAVPAADRGRVGVRLPGRDHDPLVLGRRPRVARRVRLDPQNAGNALPPGRPEAAQRLRPLRHARQRLGVVLRRFGPYAAGPASTRRARPRASSGAPGRVVRLGQVERTRSASRLGYPAHSPTTIRVPGLPPATP